MGSQRVGHNWATFTSPVEKCSLQKTFGQCCFSPEHYREGEYLVFIWRVAGILISGFIILPNCCFSCVMAGTLTHSFPLTCECAHTPTSTHMHTHTHTPSDTLTTPPHTPHIPPHTHTHTHMLVYMFLCYSLYLSHPVLPIPTPVSISISL